MRDNKMNQEKPEAIEELYGLTSKIKEAYHPLKENISEGNIDRFYKAYREFVAQRSRVLRKPEISSNYSKTIDKLTSFVMELGNHVEYYLVKSKVAK